MSETKRSETNDKTISVETEQQPPKQPRRDRPTAKPPIALPTTLDEMVNLNTIEKAFERYMSNADCAAAVRVAYLKGVKDLVVENKVFRDTLLHIFEAAEVKVKATSYTNDCKVIEHTIDVKASGTYDTNVLQAAAAFLVSKLSAQKIQIQTVEQDLNRKVDELKRQKQANETLERQLSELRNRPPPPQVVLPFVLSFNFTKNGKIKTKYVAHTDGAWTVTLKLAQAKRFATQGEAVSRLIALCESTTPVKNIAAYKICSLHYMDVSGLEALGAETYNTLNKARSLSTQLVFETTSKKAHR